MASIRDYYLLTKPGIVYGNSLHYVAGALLAATSTWSFSAALGGLVGVATIIASGCIVNNYIDRDIDKKMKRTSSRPSATGTIRLANGLIFAAILLIVGFAALMVYTNTLTVWLGVIAYISYTFVYTLSKRYTVHHTLIGLIPGALPAVAGYTALTGAMDEIAWLLFAVLALWQLPHFYAIGLYRKKEYKQAGVPLLTDKYSEHAVKYIIAVIVALYAFTVVIFSYLGLTIVGATLLTGAALWWLYMVLQTWSKPVDKWARGVFFRSLVITLLLPVAMLLNLAYEIFT